MRCFVLPSAPERCLVCRAAAHAPLDTCVISVLAGPAAFSWLRTWPCNAQLAAVVHGAVAVFVSKTPNY